MFSTTDVRFEQCRKEKEVLVKDALKKAGSIGPSLLDEEVSYFFHELGLQSNYFAEMSVEDISKHISGLYASKLICKASKKEVIHLTLDTPDHCVYMMSSSPNNVESPVKQVEREIGEKYMTSVQDYRIQAYRSLNPLARDFTSHLKIYVVFRAEYGGEGEGISAIGSKGFLSLATTHTNQIYMEMIAASERQMGISCRLVDSVREEKRLIVCFRKKDASHKFFSVLSDLYRFYALTSPRKYVETFSNGYVVMSLFLTPRTEGMSDFEAALEMVLHSVNLAFIIPYTKLQRLVARKELSTKECAYAYAAWKFASQFLSRLGSTYTELCQALDMTKPEHAAIMDGLKQKLVNDTFSEDYLFSVIVQHPDLIRLLYSDFFWRHLPDKSIEMYPLEKNRVAARATDEEVERQVKELAGRAGQHERMVFDMFRMFNRYMLKTNFFVCSKSALSFRFDPKFLEEGDHHLYEEIPFGIFLVIGTHFRGFHVRFRDVARGGIRIVRSRDLNVYKRNIATIFEENFNLALTQQKKNKDIPEGGSKGVILLRLDAQSHEMVEVAFRHYVDALLDLLLLPSSHMVDRYGQTELLFLGPDEGSAELMDWASEHARNRGYQYWRAFTTGKAHGGVPHDVYGMTTSGVHQYVLGIIDKLGLREEDVRKIQTGGPDGDLGSNEILISKDHTVAVVDGSGVLYDPNGINREELVRLAKERKMVRNFDPKKLSSGGYFVDVDENGVQKGDLHIESGVQFRNAYHFHPHAHADLFVPCGGRPASVTIRNVDAFLRLPNGALRYKYVVEGANLFFTQAARLVLEKEGVIVFKDASANKGGVTSSSLEVLASLSLSEAEYEAHMISKDGKNPTFYDNYVQEILAVIGRNARMEFECLWREHKRTQTPQSVLCDLLSYKINVLHDELANSSLFEDKAFTDKILSRCLPQVLLKQVGLQAVRERVPENYIRAIFGSYLASNYVYKYGLETRETSFFEFIAQLKTDA